MKKIVLLFISIALLSLTLLFAQDKIEVTAQIRPRLLIDNRDFNSNTGANSFTQLRSRLGVGFLASNNLYGFVQIQDSRVFGSEPSTLSDTKNLDLHQAYFNIKEIFKLPFNLTIGRMELSYGSQVRI